MRPGDHPVVPSKNRVNGRSLAKIAEGKCHEMFKSRLQSRHWSRRLSPWVVQQTSLLFKTLPRCLRGRALEENPNWTYNDIALWNYAELPKARTATSHNTYRHRQGSARVRIDPRQGEGRIRQHPCLITDRPDSRPCSLLSLSVYGPPPASSRSACAPPGYR